jgi:hypothetical protein
MNRHRPEDELPEVRAADQAIRAAALRGLPARPHQAGPARGAGS